MKSFYTAGLILLTSFIALNTLSCKKSDGDPMIPPAIVFKTTAGYTYKDTAVGKGVNILTGIDAAKTELNDVLKLYTITRSYDGGAASNVYSETLSGTAGDAYSKDYTITTRNTVGTEKYTFTVSNRDGLTNSISLTLTVQ